MRKLSLSQMLKNVGAFALVSATGVDAGLLLADRTRTFDISPDWYINGPLAVWFVTSIPVTITLASRIMHQIDPRPGRIMAFEEGSPSPVVRSISFNAQGRRGKLLATVAPNAFGEELHPDDRQVYRPAAWKVPVDNNHVVVRESELRAFLDVAYRRAKYQFSRNYWTKTRRPPLWRPRYEAFMRLLVEAGLVEGRHAQGGASGRLVTKPHHCITFLKYESPYAVTR